MLDYVKTILKKVSFNGQLFEKELKKAIASLLKEEVAKLKEWCYKKFRQVHEPILNRCFAAI